MNKCDTCESPASCEWWGIRFCDGCYETRIGTSGIEPLIRPEIRFFDDPEASIPKGQIDDREIYDMKTEGGW